MESQEESLKSSMRCNENQPFLTWMDLGPWQWRSGGQGGCGTQHGLSSGLSLQIPLSRIF